MLVRLNSLLRNFNYFVGQVRWGRVILNSG
jgi:hypothetical protein